MHALRLAAGCSRSLSIPPPGVCGPGPCSRHVTCAASKRKTLHSELESQQHRLSELESALKPEDTTESNKPLAMVVKELQELNKSVSSLSMQLPSSSSSSESEDEGMKAEKKAAKMQAKAAKKAAKELKKQQKMQATSLYDTAQLANSKLDALAHQRYGAAPPAITVQVCQNKTCRNRGSPMLLDELRAASSSADVEVRPCGCLDQCKRGPNVAVRLPGQPKQVYIGLDNAAKIAQLVSDVQAAQQQGSKEARNRRLLL